MRERVGAFGGTLTTGPTPPGGFLVDATLPFDTPTGVEAS
jgi:signal transduction histidine kinase